MARKRRGSSTRKYKHPVLPFEPKKEATTVVVTPSKQQKVLDKLKQQLRIRIDHKGKTLTDEDITKKLTTISNLEHKLGIVHTE